MPGGKPFLCVFCKLADSVNKLDDSVNKLVDKLNKIGYYDIKMIFR